MPRSPNNNLDYRDSYILNQEQNRKSNSSIESLHYLMLSEVSLRFQPDVVEVSKLTTFSQYNENQADHENQPPRQLSAKRKLNQLFFFFLSRQRVIIVQDIHTLIQQ